MKPSTSADDDVAEVAVGVVLVVVVVVAFDLYWSQKRNGQTSTSPRKPSIRCTMQPIPVNY